MFDTQWLVRLTFELSALGLLVFGWYRDNYRVDPSQHLIDTQSCRECGKELNRRNESGLCRSCNAREMGRKNRKYSQE